MKTKIKICGLKRIEDVISVNVAEPDYCGFIFNVSGSRRSIGAEQLNILVDMLNPEIVPIGVFVNEKTDVILRIVRESGIRMVQLHGQVNGEIIHTIQSKAQVPVIKAVSVRSKEDVRSAVLSPADYLLFDCGEGGTGQTFDWNLLEDIPRPYFMAGGIGTHNMEEVLRRFSPFALDVNSSVETDRQKDGKKILAAVRMLRTLAE
ncbi:phosphoribosylanthranilate isomerase [Sellimonas intestinalis]|uniref:phosphoribosylanthranilate isomerase n=1 Tax=Sellimonas intestinalis TaxID=1653434 RepID=UPI0015EC0DB9|nr:phosphoribosylanthranilate isomerase [Sellimonas intestinalis]MBA2212572.1 phosphoribosylanthranilate isomerase [Sellimonas intestinalis]